MKPPIDLTPLQQDYSVFLPAISSFYSTYVAKQRLGEYIPKDRMPAGFDRGVEGMNFLNLEQGYFTYKYALYSAGHAQLDLKKAFTDDSMLQQRDRANTMVLGDSGGYQIGKGILKFDWKDFEGKSANKTRSEIVNWLEATADWSMTLDVPIWACDKNNRVRTGLTSPDDCLAKTRFNNEFFIKNRQGKTKYLNVLQGSDWLSAETWYEGVKEYSDNNIYGDQAFEGWAFGGVNMSKMDMTLKRIMILREEGLLAGKDWIHFLGTAQLDWACYLTSIQRRIREHINENLTISFDCASPFVATAHGLTYTNAAHTSKKFSVVMDKAPDNKALAESTIPFPFESEFGRRLVMGDICHYDLGQRKTDAELNGVKFNHLDPKHYHVAPRVNKLGKIPTNTSWDSFAYALMMGHNVYCHIVAVQRANQLADIECAKYKPDWREWNKLNAKNLNSNQFSEWVPRSILYFDRFVEELFATKTLAEAMDMLEQPNAKSFLTSIAGARNTTNGQSDNMFGNLFSVEEVTRADDIWLENPEDEKLRALEDDLKSE
jgi:hypothetical protein